MKETIEGIGYMAKGSFDSGKLPWDGNMLYIYKNKGRKEDWWAEDWPPIKVRITLTRIRRKK